MPFGNQPKDEPAAPRKFYVDALLRITTPDAWRLQTLQSLTDSDEEATALRSAPRPSR
jgi:hypothetical protein